MSKLENLIKDLCPNGVQYSSIGSLITRIRERGKDNKDTQQVYVVSNTLGMVKAEEFRENTIHSEDTSNYTVIKPNMYAYNPSRLNIGSIAMLKDNAPGLVSPMYVVFSIDEQKIMKEYFEYNIKSSFVRNKIKTLKEEGARFRFDFNRWEWIQIAIPPLPVQQEIVRILDNFTELSLELSLEHIARKKQYDYYKKSLLSQSNTVFVTKLGEVATLKTGSKLKEILEEKDKFEYINAGTSNSGYARDFNCGGDTVTTPSRGQGGIGFVGYQKNSFWLGPLCYRIKSKDTNILLNRYLYHYLSCFNDRILHYKNAGGTPSVNASDLVNIAIDIPSIDEQKRIIAILDSFDTLCNDLTSGLPAEIEARRKQYEYYRDKLLTFKEASA